TYPEWDRLSDQARTMYIAGAYDSLVSIASPETASTSRHYSKCVSGRVPIEQLAKNVRTFVAARPDLQRKPVQVGLITYLIERCGAQRNCDVVPTAEVGAGRAVGRRAEPAGMHCHAAACTGCTDLFNHLVGGREQPVGNLEAERLCGLEIDRQLVLDRVLHRKVGRLLALEDAIDVTGRAPVRVGRVGGVGDEAAGGDEVGPGVDRRQRVPGRE